MWIVYLLYILTQKMLLYTKLLVFCREDLCFVLEAVHIKLKVLILL